MSPEDLKRLENLVRVISLSVAAMAEIEGMKADNSERKSNGHANAYGGDAFYCVQADLLSEVKSLLDN